MKLWWKNYGYREESPSCNRSSHDWLFVCYLTTGIVLWTNPVAMSSLFKPSWQVSLVSRWYTAMLIHPLLSSPEKRELSVDGTKLRKLKRIRANKNQKEPWVFVHRIGWNRVHSVLSVIPMELSPITVALLLSMPRRFLLDLLGLGTMLLLYTRLLSSSRTGLRSNLNLIWMRP